MNLFPGIKKTVLAAAAFCFLLTSASSQHISPSLFNCMKWRMIGPYRGGRTVGAAGIASQPNVFYMGVNNGGIWKTNDCGRTWNPVFDDQSTGSIGDVAVAPSNPNVIYAGSGEGLQRPDLSTGNGMYRSSDAGKTWTHLGLENAWQIGGLAIDPRDENKVFVAALGHPYGPNPERGVYRTHDGGKNWSRVLFTDENTGAVEVQIDPQNSQVIYADLWAARQAPWENGSWEGEGSGLFKSTDGGNTWKRIGKGLPGKAQGLGRIGFCISMSLPSRLYAVINSTEAGGIYRSDDSGESWTLLNADPRLWDRGDDFAEIKTDPKNPDVVYDANVVVWKSTDGGKQWNGFKGAPGGDDYHRLWINPEHTDIMLLCGDQGGITTVNGGATWSSWYNQPTAQLYHVSADNAFPYNVYSGQQESGSVGISSRGNDGFISCREWHPVGAEEYGYVVADPLDPNMIYGGKISRYNKLTGQTQDISPSPARDGKYRFLRTAPIVFSPRDPHILYYAGNVVFKTSTGGNSWEVISPDLTRTSYDLPACIGTYGKESMKTMRRRGVIYTLAPSPLDVNVIWAGTDDGLIQLTRDGGKNWINVSPPQLSSWHKVSLMEASHTDINTAYAAVNCIRLDDERPHIYRTTDGGKTWKEITNGLPAGPINVVKEDPERKGLLFAGSETQVYVSFNDGDLWQSLRLNMAPSSVRDLVIKDNDLIAATHGRSFWILDDITALRQVNPELKEK
ncbi:MAG TPA: glycoside hydrolase, partial [Bacteroidia bacterium]|nr:glycoside hydrolase [Bacteroidia bacterium]